MSDNAIMTTVPYGTGMVGGVGAWQEEEPSSGTCSAVQTAHSFLPLPAEISADLLASGSFSQWWSRALGCEFAQYLPSARENGLWAKVQTGSYVTELHPVLEKAFKIEKQMS